MSLIYVAVALALVLVNLMALTVVGARIAPPAVARVAGVLLVVLPLFALEHFVGLGSLHGVWPFTTLASLLVLWRWPPTSEILRAEGVFLVCLLYALLWRIVDANIDPNGEALTDLYFISNYLSGDALPPPDRWLGGAQPFDFYYGFQHYAAALMGRAFSFSPGLTLNLASVLAVALMGSLAWYVASCFVVQRWVKTLIVATLLVGGNGLTPLLLAAIEPAPQASATTSQATAAAGAEQLWAATRFSGLFEDRINTDFGRRWLRDPAPVSESADHLAMDLPLETPAYLLLLGDFHPPLGGWVLLLFALALMAWIDGARRGSVGASPAPPLATAMLAATPVVVLVTNAWVFPWQAALVGLWLGVRAVRGEVDVKAAVAGVAIALALIYPFLGHFASQALSPSLELVPDTFRTRVAVWLGLHWPMLVLLGLALGSALAHRVMRSPSAGGSSARLATHFDNLFFAGFIGLVLIFCELFFFDDPNGGKYERFNTVLKSWSWLWPLALVALVPRLWAVGDPVARSLLLVMCVALLLNVWNVGRYLWNADVTGGARLAGEGWLRADPANGNLLNQLSSAPDGVVLERPQGAAYDAVSAFALFAGKPAALGWPAHQQGWLGGSPLIAAEERGVRLFFSGDLPDALDWLAERRVRYIVWSRRDEAALPGMRARLDALLEAQYEFRSTEVRGEQRIGYWERRP